MQILKSNFLCLYNLLITICLLSCLGFSADSEAKTNLVDSVYDDSNQSLFFISITGDEQGLITKNASSADSIGNLFLESHIDEIIGLGLSHGIMVAAGESNHRKLSILKLFDRCGPLLYQALIKAEKLTVEIKFYRTSLNGTTEHYFTINLDDANIVEINSGAEIKSELGTNVSMHTEEISFEYKTITWEHVVTGTSYMDSWNSVQE